MGLYEIEKIENRSDIYQHDKDSDYSDWEGIENGKSITPTEKAGILKRKYYEGDTSNEGSATVVIEQLSQPDEISPHENVSSEISKAVLSASIQKAKVAALQAYMYGFPEPSVYRDETDPLGLNDESSDDSDSKKKIFKDIDVEVEFGKKRMKQSNNKKLKTRYLTKSERVQNAKWERNRNKEKRTRAKEKSK